MTNQVADILKTQKEVTGYTASIGDGLPKLYYSMAPPLRSVNTAQVMFKVDLKKGNRFKRNEEFADYLQSILDSEIAQGTAAIKLLEQGEPIGAPVRIRVTGESSQTVLAVEKIKGVLKGIEGTSNIWDNYSADTYDYMVNIDSDEALRLGVLKYDIQKELNIALMGRNAGYLNAYAGGGIENQENSTQIPVRVFSDIKNVDMMELYMVKSSVTGQKILLKQLSEIGLKSGITQIQKYNRMPSITVYSDVRQGFSSVDIQRQTEEKLKEMDLGDVKIVFDGERESIMKYFGNIGVLAVLAVFVIFMILMIQFGSFSQPFIIMATIPLSAVGSILGLYLTGQPLSFTSLLGIVSLFGIVVNNAIVLVDFINMEKSMGKETEEAGIDAVEKRFRPIMLTTVTTLVGLTPLIFSGSNLFTPMSVSLASGLAVSTFLTLVIIPVVYAIVENGREKAARVRKI
jgi:multidrug efflux pump subunit AcrB